MRLKDFAVVLKDFSNSYVISLLKDFFLYICGKNFHGSRLVKLNVPV